MNNDKVTTRQYCMKQISVRLLKRKYHCYYLLLYFCWIGNRHISMKLTVIRLSSIYYFPWRYKIRATSLIVLLWLCWTLMLSEISHLIVTCAGSAALFPDCVCVMFHCWGQTSLRSVRRTFPPSEHSGAGCGVFKSWETWNRVCATISAAPSRQSV